MVTYKPKTQTWKFGPPYSRGIYWLFEVLTIVTIMATIILFTKGAVLFPFIPFHDHVGPALPLFTIISLVVLVVLIPSFIFVFSYSPRVVHLTYDEVILMRGLTGLFKKRIRYRDIIEVELFYSDQPSGEPEWFSRLSYFLLTLAGKDAHSREDEDENYMVSLMLLGGERCDFQVEKPNDFVRLTKDKIDRFRREDRKKKPDSLTV